MMARRPGSPWLTRTLLTVLLTCVVLLAAGLPVVAGSAVADARTAEVAPASSDHRSRLDRAADALRRGPLFVEDELSWMLDADATRSLRHDLAQARVPVLVAYLPSLTEDESGGDTRRTLRALQQKVGRDGVYVTVDQRGAMDLASVGVPLDLMIPFSLLLPPRDERPIEAQVDDPPPGGWTSVPDRLGRVLRRVRDAKSGQPNGIVDDVRPLATLPGHHGPTNSAQDIVALGFVGLVVGLSVAAMILTVRRSVRRRRDRRAAATAPARRRRSGRRA